MTPHTLFVVDDEAVIREGLAAALGTDYQVMVFSDAETALAKLPDSQPDLVLLDIGLPGISGLKALEEMKAICPDLLVIMITAYEGVENVISAMKTGAYDYIVKPIRIRILVHRLNALLNRAKRPNLGKVLQVEDLKVNVDKHLVLMGAEQLKLTRKEFELLLLFAENPTKSFSRREIFTRVWGKDSQVLDKTVNVHLSRLRKKLNKEMIISVDGQSYKLI